MAERLEINENLANEEITYEELKDKLDSEMLALEGMLSHATDKNLMSTQQIDKTKDTLHGMKKSIEGMKQDVFTGTKSEILTSTGLLLLSFLENMKRNFKDQISKMTDNKEKFESIKLELDNQIKTTEALRTYVSPIKLDNFNTALIKIKENRKAMDEIIDYSDETLLIYKSVLDTIQLIVQTLTKHHIPTSGEEEMKMPEVMEEIIDIQPSGVNDDNTDDL